MSRLSRTPCVAAPPGGGGCGPDTTGPPRGTSCPSDPICTGAILQRRYSLVSYDDAHPALQRKTNRVVVANSLRIDVIRSLTTFFLETSFFALTWFPRSPVNSTNTPNLVTHDEEHSMPLSRHLCCPYRSVGRKTQTGSTGMEVGILGHWFPDRLSFDPNILYCLRGKHDCCLVKVSTGLARWLTVCHLLTVYFHIS